ncbi:MAG: 30S ribosomal protein S16 [Patescibacteria group bacterium]
MLILRLQSVGKKHQKIFRLVLQEKQNKLDGKAIANLGWWNPRLKKGDFNSEKINFYISHGAKLSDTAWNLLIKKGVLKGKKRAVNIAVSPNKKKK